MTDFKGMPEEMKQAIMLPWKPITFPSAETREAVTIHTTLRMIHQRMQGDPQAKMLGMIGAVVGELAAIYSAYHSLTNRGEIAGGPVVDPTDLGKRIIECINTYEPSPK